jgi:hypothetical protein
MYLPNINTVVYLVFISAVRLRKNSCIHLTDIKIFKWWTVLPKTEANVSVILLATHPFNNICIYTNVGRDISVCVSNSGDGEISCNHPYRPQGPPSLLYNGYRFSLPWVKRPGRGIDHFPLSTAEVIERVNLTSTHLLMTLMVCSRVNFTSSKQEGKGPGNSVGIATGYGLDHPGIESRCGRDFSQPSRPALRSSQPPIQWVRVFPGG